MNVYFDRITTVIIFCQNTHNGNDGANCCNVNNKRTKHWCFIFHLLQYNAGIVTVQA